MLTEEIHAAGVADKIAEHEEAAHEKRNWVRLTFDCNNRCIFCLDSDTHDGEIRARDEIKAQILDGRKKGATRLILSGGEPTMHPYYIEFIKLGSTMGYRKVQTVTNGRMFSYPGFLNRCLEAGLSEITFSIHGPNAKIHDALVGVKGAYEQEMEGLRMALTDGRPIVNIDVVINRGNVKHLPDMLKKYYELGVREFDLLQVVPFGRAFTEGRDTLFYDLEEMQPYIRQALEFSKMPDVHVWMNRFPPQHLEGFEHLVQDPYKLNDEVRGRKEEFTRLLDEGVNLDCRDPNRCKYCYVQRLCDTLDVQRETLASQKFELVRVDTEWEAKQGPVYGGDPASARRARSEQRENGGDGRRHLDVLAGPVPPKRVSIEEVVNSSGCKRMMLVSPDLARATAQLARFPGATEVDLDLERYDGLSDAISADGALGKVKITSAVAHSVAQVETLLALDATFEIVVLLTRDTAAWLLAQSAVSGRIVLRQPYYERLTEAAEKDVDLREFFAKFQSPVPLEGIPACVSGRLPRQALRTLDTAMLATDGGLEIFRYTQRFIVEHYLTKSLRCKSCVYHDTCNGVHINYVRAHGYSLMQPVASDAQ